MAKHKFLCYPTISFGTIRVRYKKLRYFMINADQKKLLTNFRKEETDILTELSSFAQKDSRVDGGFIVPYPNEGTGLDENAREIEEFERLNALKNNLAKRLRDVRATITRIEAGLYGQCVNCFSSIEHTRLRVAPVARLCISCAKLNPREA
ncbi:MAG: hypothetical protein Q7S32_02530 [bacterium]|nr:hypothetical protein [bacterium]